MQHPEPRIQCSNPQCAASNALEAHCCHRCGTPIVRRYLWSDQVVITPEEVNTLINGRYLAFSNQIFLDTQPNKPPHTPEEVPADIVAYLQLFSCYPNVPQVYGLLGKENAWLFDYGTVPSDLDGKLNQPQHLVPKLTSLWSEANPLQQLSWLWQIAKLWKPLANKKVASTLLNPDLLRINGQIVQVMQLEPDGSNPPNLQKLGQLWQTWLKEARPEIKEVLEQISSRLSTGKIAKIGQAFALLDRAANECQKKQTYAYSTYALTDSGPNRSNNEDAAYPIVETENLSTQNTSLTIVCDGVGGHDGGEVASRTTIEHLRDEISSLNIGTEDLSPRKILKHLAKYINSVNDLISDRNDSEQRQERQRMGTTLVMTLARAHEMYLAHVGDSRIYWISRNSCHQVTVDDDLASREVRLGYAIYRDSLQYPSAGALIQALGMRDSAALHPNLQRYLIDDDCVFLLCTDGLSDFDRVEQQWRSKILPILAGEQDLTSTVKDLISFANEENGHDNVTVALVHCQVRPDPNLASTKVSWSEIEQALTDPHAWSDDNSVISSEWSDPERTENTAKDTDIPNQQITDVPISESQIGEVSAAKNQSKWLKPLILVLLGVTIACGVAYYCILREPETNDKSPTFGDRESEIRPGNGSNSAN